MENFRNSSQSGNDKLYKEQYRHANKVRKHILTNRLNYINFQDDTILVTFQHTEHQHTASFRAKPQPCLGHELFCTWLKTEKARLRRLISYRFKDIKILNGKIMTIIKPVDIHISEKGIHALLPESGIEVSSRVHDRYSCNRINAQLIQNGASYAGELLDFSVVSFHVKIQESSTEAFSWIEIGSTLTLILSASGNMLYAGECHILKCDKGKCYRSFVLIPLNEHIRRFKPKDFRPVRQHLIPKPYISFQHPLTQKQTKLRIIDMSGSGFSVMENIDNSLLLPGLIIPEICIHIAGVFMATCKSQVVYRSIQKDSDLNEFVKCGIAILDMNFEEHCNLLALLYQAKDEKSFLGTQVDPDDLWQFLFETGFIYPDKYAFLEKNKKTIKEVYKKIYSEPSKIAKHFLYQDNGKILGHMAMIRFYEKSWMIHHHAANSTASNKAGIDVLDQISRFIHESHRILSNKMDYVFCYYRPDNKFPNRIFGGITENINSPKICSSDRFAYFHFTKNSNEQKELPGTWRLLNVVPEDLTELKFFYKSTSNGLMLHALEMLSESTDMKDLLPEYDRMGFKRKKYLFSLKKGNELKAIMLINISDIGLNLSDLTNSIHLFLLDSAGITPDILFTALSKFSDFFERNHIPILLYPEAAAGYLNISYDRSYSLWVVDVEESDLYFKYLRKFLKRINHLKSLGN